MRKSTDVEQIAYVCIVGVLDILQSVVPIVPIASGNITEEFELVRVVLDDLTCAISFNIISSPEHPIVLGLTWFKLHNPSIDLWKRTIRCRSQGEKAFRVKAEYHKISTMSLQQLRKKGRKEEMFLFAVLVKPF